MEWGIIFISAKREIGGFGIELRTRNPNIS
jgi:hypothetical protein